MTVIHCDALVIGAGIIGTAVAHALALSGQFPRIRVIDKEPEPNLHQTGRNSGVIHSGVYYPQGSLKSRTCLDGYRRMVDFCDENGIAYRITGKLIAAAEASEYAELDRLFDNAVAVGLDVERMDANSIRELDPGLVSERGFRVGQTGLVSYRDVLAKLVERGRAMGVTYGWGTQVSQVQRDASGQTLRLGDDRIAAGLIVNCAGLQCDRVFQQVTGERCPVSILPFKGEYYYIDPGTYRSDVPVYPVPNPEFPFLGVHLTRTIDGRLKVGPNAVLSFDREGYDGRRFRWRDTVSALSNPALFGIVKRYRAAVVAELLKQGSKAYFERSVRKYWSTFDRSQIQGYTCGIRAQATENGRLLSDFRIERMDRQVHVLNAPSPAATSCLSIAQTVLDEINSLN